MDRKDAVAFWDARYARGLVYGTQPTSIVHRLVPLLHAHKVRRLLEAGCGSGRDALFYARAGFEVTGTDISEQALRWARQRAEAEGLDASFLADDLAETRLPAGSFDAAIAVHLLHLQLEDVRQAMVNQLWRLARDAGLIALANYATREDGFDGWQRHAEPNTRIDPKGKLVHFFTEEEVRDLLAPDRFEILTLEEVDLAEVPDSGPVSHREWLVAARKIRAC
jgi:2-polyprenyl-3-methyl-5-hydroxy-6-metoxy-1,4-benzoquinol methylase